MPSLTPRRSVPHLRVLVAVLVGYVVVVVAVLAWPTPVDSGAAGPLKEALAWLRRHNLGWITYDAVEFSANIAMFIPFGLLVPFAFPRVHWWQVLAGAVTASAAAELAQTLLRPDRFGTVTDIVANATGTALGLLLAARIRSVRTARLEELAQLR